MPMQVLLGDPPPPPAEVAYPESDGRPMAETDVHIQVLLDLRTMLAIHFASAPDVYVAGNNFLYYAEGDPTQVVSPDLYLVRGLAHAKELRRIYKLWEEGRAPDWVLEATSLSTRYQDRGAKKGLYEALGVREYVLYDPLGEYLDPPLQGYELVQGRYVPLAATAEGGLRSRVLGLELRREDGRLRLWDPRSDRYLLTPMEEAAGRQQAEARAAEAEAEVARLRAEIAHLRGRSSG